MQIRPHDFSVNPKSACKKLFVDVCACSAARVVSFQKKFFLYNIFVCLFYQAPNLSYLALFSSEDEITF